MKTQTATQTKPMSILNVPWMVEPIEEMTTRTRDCDGRFLRQNVKLNVAAKVHASADVALAAAWGVDADELFA